MRPNSDFRPEFVRQLLDDLDGYGNPTDSELLDMARKAVDKANTRMKRQTRKHAKTCQTVRTCIDAQRKAQAPKRNHEAPRSQSDELQHDPGSRRPPRLGPG